MKTGMSMSRVGIVQTNVFGALAYHARCFECGWESKRVNREAQAVKVGKVHGQQHVAPAEK